jgi:ComF family protein
MNFAFFAEIFFPSVCLACGVKTHNIWCCGACRTSVSIEGTSAKGRYAEFHAAARYDNPVVKKLIHQLKFNFMKPAAMPLAEIIAEYIAGCKDLSRIFLEDATLIPVPLSRKRKRERGFNQSELIARHLGNLIHARVANDVLVRVRHAKPQSEAASAEERRQNIRRVFAVQRPPPPGHIILIDDVVTTGSTFREAERTLRAAGAHRVTAIAAARS